VSFEEFFAGLPYIVRYLAAPVIGGILLALYGDKKPEQEPTESKKPKKRRRQKKKK
jgi:hypothetical protein